MIKNIIMSMVLIALIMGGIAVGQDFVKRESVQLSGVNFSIFDMNTMFMSDEWFMDMTMDSWTPSMKAFMKDNPNDGKGLGANATKHALVGSSVTSEFKLRP
jgi:hypothetical protein